jgi:serine/threonine protein kinase
VRNIWAHNSQQEFTKEESDRHLGAICALLEKEPLLAALPEARLTLEKLERIRDRDWRIVDNEEGIESTMWDTSATIDSADTTGGTFAIVGDVTVRREKVTAQEEEKASEAKNQEENVPYLRTKRRMFQATRFEGNVDSGNGAYFDAGGSKILTSSSGTSYVLLRKLQQCTGSIRGEVRYACVIKQNPDGGGSWCVDMEQRPWKRAIKMLEMPSVRDNAADAQREVELNALMRSLRHDNVCRFYECALDQHSMCLVLDFCDGGDLFENVAEGSVGDTPRVKTVFRQIMEGLCHLHRHNISHMDMKVENMMLTDGGDLVKIIDFGLSLPGDMQEGGTVRGTVQCMAPEVYAQARGYSGFKADVWSCGVMLFLMLAGAPPFEKPDISDPRYDLVSNRSPGALLEHWVKESDDAELVRLLRCITPAAKDLLAQMMCVDPTQRPDAQAVLDHPWLKTQ